jgi:hypothetical protein
MRRVVYCPSEVMLEDASELAKQNGLPINIGIFEGIKNIEFDPNKVQVLEVPEHKFVVFLQNVKNNYHQNINYYNDYVKFDKLITLSINNKNYYPILIEKHKIKFIINELEIGNKYCNIIFNNQILESFEYNVY